MENIKGIAWKELAEDLGIGNKNNLNALFLNTVERLDLVLGKDYFRIEVPNPAPRDPVENFVTWETAMKIAEASYSDSKEKVIQELKGRKKEFVK